jgi:hypothetical protein
MGVLSVAASAAVRWLTRAWRVYRTYQTEINMGMAAIKNMGFATKMVTKFFELQAKVERTVGAKTDAWRKIHNGARDKRSVTLSIEDVRYLNKFKGVFDKTIKRVVKK